MLSAIALVLLMGLVAGLPSLWTRDLWHDDEIRLTEGARELLQSRGGLLPCVNGEIDFTAPPLPYWATSLLWEAGAGVASARVLSVLSVVGILLVCFAATVRSGSIARGVMAAAIALTTVVLFWHVRKGGAGPFWASLLTCALLAGYQALACKARRGAAWWVACYASAALAVLAVGVSAALLAAFVLAVYCLAARKLTGDLAGLGESLREGNLLKAILATAAALFPWIVIVPGAIAAAVRNRPDHGTSLPLFSTIWLGALAVPAVLGGREGAPDYALAMVAPLAMLCAGALVPDGLRSRCPSVARRWLFRGALGIVGGFTGLLLLAGLLDLAGVSYLFVGKRHVCPVTDQPYSPYALAAIVPFVAASFGAVVAAFRTPVGRPDRRAWLLILAVFLLGIPADLFLTPFVNAFCRRKAPQESDGSQRVAVARGGGRHGWQPAYGPAQRRQPHDQRQSGGPASPVFRSSSRNCSIVSGGLPQ